MGARSAVSGIGGQQFVDQLVDGDQLDRPHVRGAAAVLVSSKNQGRASRAVGPGPHGGPRRGPRSRVTSALPLRSRRPRPTLRALT